MNLLSASPNGALLGSIELPRDPDDTQSEIDAPGTVKASAVITLELNAAIKQEARNRGITAAELAGLWLSEKVNDYLVSSRAKQRQQLRELFGDDWKDQIRGLID